MKEKKTFESLYKKLKKEEKETGKKFDKVALNFAKAVDKFKQAQIDTGLSISKVYKEGRR